MRRRIEGLRDSTRSATEEVPNVFLVRVERVRFRWHAHKPFYELRFSVLEPQNRAGQAICSRLYCTPKALWKLGWFLRDFAYDSELFGRDEIDDRIIVGLQGVVFTHATNHTSLLRLDGFAPASQWEEFSATSPANLSGSEVAK